MSKFLNCVLFSALVGLAMPAHGADPLHLAPASKWNIEYDDDSCRLTRVFGEGGEKTAFMIERFAPGADFLMVVAGASLKGGRRDKALLRFGPGEQEVDRIVMRGELTEFSPALIASSMRLAAHDPSADDDAEAETQPPKSFAALAADEQGIAKGVSWLSIGKFGHREVVLDLGNMADPIAALQTCTRELITHWGIDAERHATLSRLATPATSPGTWMTSNDYPHDMLRKGMQGLVQFRLMIDERGTATACHIQSSTRPQEFDDAVCRNLMRRARFEPALDAQGKPLASYFRSTVRFELPS